MTTGAKIQHLRKSNGMSQEELASKITVSRQAVSKWELDESLPDTDNIVQLSLIFKVTADYLLRDNMDSEQDLPVAQNMKKRAGKKNYVKLAAFIVFLTAVTVLGAISKAIVVVLSALSLAVTIYLVYLLIAFLRRSTKQ